MKTTIPIAIVAYIAIVNPCQIEAVGHDSDVFDIQTSIINPRILVESNVWVLMFLTNNSESEAPLPSVRLLCDQRPCDGVFGSIDLTNSIPLPANGRKTYVFSATLSQLDFTELSVHLRGLLADGIAWSETVPVGTVETVEPVDEIDKALLAEYLASDASSLAYFLERKVGRGFMELGCPSDNPCMERFLAGCDWCTSNYYVARSYKYFGDLLGQIESRGFNVRAAPSVTSSAYDAPAVRRVLEAELDHLEKLGKEREANMLRALECITAEECNELEFVSAYCSELHIPLVSED